jgi:hypothetical protein
MYQRSTHRYAIPERPTGYIRFMDLFICWKPAANNVYTGIVVIGQDNLSNHYGIKKQA